jgi:Ecdysteroid kinase-like family
MTTPSLPPAAGAEQLTVALRKSGALGDGRVRGVTVERSFDTVLSQIFRLRLTYDGDATDAPGSVILKTVIAARAQTFWNAGRKEVGFYKDVACAMNEHLVPRCYEAVCDADARSWHLLLEDLTDTHFIATAWPLPPTFGQCEQIMRARARFHAAWWDDSRLGITVGTWPNPAELDQQLKGLADRIVQFTERHGECLSPGRRDLYARLLDAAPRLQARQRSRRNVTIVQGDSHVWNIFLPKDEDGGGALQFDWDCWNIDVASDDLAYMMAMHWYPDLRRRIERPLLDCYHAELLARGVRGYDRQALDDDYRLSALWLTTTPLWQEGNNIPPVIWWNNLERIFLAADDLGCRELLD